MDAVTHTTTGLMSLNATEQTAVYIYNYHKQVTSLQNKTHRLNRSEHDARGQVSMPQCRNGIGLKMYSGISHFLAFSRSIGRQSRTLVKFKF